MKKALKWCFSQPLWLTFSLNFAICLSAFVVSVIGLFLMPMQSMRWRLLPAAFFILTVSVVVIFSIVITAFHGVAYARAKSWSKVLLIVLAIAGLLIEFLIAGLGMMLLMRIGLPMP